MRTVRLLAVLLFLLPLVQLAVAQQLDRESIEEVRRFQLNDSVMRRYDDLVQASTASRMHRGTTQAWPVRSVPATLPQHLDDAAAVLEATQPIGPMLREHHLTGKEYLSILFLRMGACETIQARRMLLRSPAASAVVPAAKPWVSAENLAFLERHDGVLPM